MRRVLAAVWDFWKWMSHAETYRHCPDKYTRMK